MKFVGAHVSIAGGVENAPLNADAIGAKAFAMFTKNQRQWKSPPLSDESVAAFRENCAKYGYTPAQILPHDSYLINLGNPDAGKRSAALAAFTDEMTRCSRLGLDRLNFHPGSHLKLIGEKECLALAAECVNAALDSTSGVTAVIENTAGQGSNIGYSFEQLARIIELVRDHTRIGVCLDTCHAFAAGYDIGSAEGYGKTLSEFDRLIGFSFLRGVHLNDSKSLPGGHIDRHDSIGKGVLGENVFRRIMNDPRFDGIPLVLETIDETLWKYEIELLYSFVRPS